jgi:iron-sulfur cluster assembly accessory protein
VSIEAQVSQTHVAEAASVYRGALDCKDGVETGITLTPAAVDKLSAIMEEKGVRQTHALRVFVQGSGCSGLQYGMAFDNNRRPIDRVFKQHGLDVILDSQSLQYMAGSEIDYVDGPTGGGFHIENPNAMALCGCGPRGEGGASGGCSGCR